jgi:hypothetical protein
MALSAKPDDGFHPNLKEQWLRLDDDWIKVNVDRAFRISDGSRGGGVFLRDHHGDFVRSKPIFSHVADEEGAELLACRRGFILARES